MCILTINKLFYLLFHQSVTRFTQNRPNLGSFNLDIIVTIKASLTALTYVCICKYGICTYRFNLFASSHLFLKMYLFSFKNKIVALTKTLFSLLHICFVHHSCQYRFLGKRIRQESFW